MQINTVTKWTRPIKRVDVKPTVKQPRDTVSKDERLRRDTVRQRVVAMQECIICCEEKVGSEFVASVSSKCTHTNKVCKECLRIHVGEEITGKGSISVKCPECRVELQHSEVQVVASSAVFERYDRLLLGSALSKMKDFRYCTNTRCGAGHVHDGGSDNPIMTCRGCKQMSCFVDQVPWHQGISCEEYQQKIAEDPHVLANISYLQRYTKSCPNCQRSIQKSGGCNHMTCRRASGGCGHEFCWLCLSPYDIILREGNHRHATTCTYYAGA